MSWRFSIFPGAVGEPKQTRRLCNLHTDQGRGNYVLSCQNLGVVGCLKRPGSVFFTAGNLTRWRVRQLRMPKISYE